MPAIRRLASLSLAFALVFVSLSVLPVATSFVPTARACPMPTPVPLLTLYKRSARVVVASTGQTAFVEKQEHAKLVRTALSVSETLKGEGGQQAVHVYHHAWDGNGGEDYSNPHFQFGKKLLLFLTPHPKGDGYVATDETYAAKELSEDDLKVYVERVRELALILEQPDADDDARIAEWLVRCVEERATRWEGAVELSASTDALRRQNQTKTEETGAQTANTTGGEAAADGAEDATVAEDAEDAEGGEADEPVTADNDDGEAVPNTDGVVTDTQIVELPGPVRGPEANPNYVASLTDEQKSRVASAVFSAEQISESENMLLDVMRNWNDPRYVPFLVARLRREPKEDDAEQYYFDYFVSHIAHALGDKELIALSEKFTNINPYSEMTPDDEESAEGAESSGETEAAEVEETAAGEEETNADEAEEAARLEAATRMSEQKRRDALAQFLALVEARSSKREAVASIQPKN